MSRQDLTTRSNGVTSAAEASPLASGNRKGTSHSAARHLAVSPYRIDRYDVLAVTALMVVSGIFLFPALGVLEFFRHTEADRSLIALEMARSGEYVVPHLLGSVILTKPPLFYWIVASSISFFEGFEVWVLRFPSAVAATLFVGVQYLACRALQRSKLFSILSAAALGTSVQFFTLALSAEIDMTFGLLSAITLYLYAIATPRRSIPLTIASYLAASLAFLVKGPPIIGFLGATALVLYVFERPQRERLLSLLTRNLSGALFFAVAVGYWLFSISAVVGWDSLHRAFEVEVLKRVVDESTHKHGLLFYPAQALVGLAPWSIIGLLAAIPLLRQRKGKGDNTKEWTLSYFALFNLAVSITAIAMLSLAEGKSARYLFPIYPFLANLSLAALWQLRDSETEKHLLRLSRFFFIPLLLAAPIIPWFVHLEGVSAADFALPVTLAVVSSLLALRGATAGIDINRRRQFHLGALVGLMLVAQTGMTSVFAPYRNATCSVREMAKQIEAAIPVGEPLYTVEMFERWVVYYLIRDGREVFRLDAPRIAEVADQRARAFILLSFTQEAWRLSQLRFYDLSVKVVGEFRTDRDHLLLIDADVAALRYLEPLPYFPTVPSHPFYAEVEMAQHPLSPRA